MYILYIDWTILLMISSYSNELLRTKLGSRSIWLSRYCLISSLFVRIFSEVYPALLLNLLVISGMYLDVAKTLAFELA